jgi:hypothetical protein
MRRRDRLGRPGEGGRPPPAVVNRANRAPLAGGFAARLRLTLPTARRYAAMRFATNRRRTESFGVTATPSIVSSRPARLTV